MGERQGLSSNSRKALQTYSDDRQDIVHEFCMLLILTLQRLQTEYEYLSLYTLNNNLIPCQPVF